MPTPILATKLYIPPPQPKVVLRPRLIARLNAGLHGKLTLISAPAGFGKTTLVSEWIAGCHRPVAWLSLDAGDSEPTRFLSYLAAALQTLALSRVPPGREGIAPQIGGGVLDVLRSSQPPRDAAGREALLTILLNEIATLADDFILVLDDYHLIDAAPSGGNPLGAVDQALAFLLEHLPPQMHLVITTREDPQLPLARYRVRGQMTELRTADLRFTAAEAADFLNQVMGLSLATADIAALEERTEGWIAGLQLAALALQGTLSLPGQQDMPGFIQAFAGDHRYIVDYLVEEVLQRQPASVRSFLLQTAILDQLSGPLCDAVTSQQGGNARLEALQRGNFFVVPLDDKRHWYRYHHLFADVLHIHLMTEQPDLVPTLHRRASAWYADHDATADAIRHALAGGDFERAAELVERVVPAMSRMRQEAALLGWLKLLPRALLRARPVLSVVYAHLLLNSGAVDGVEEHLRDAERWLDTALDTGADSGAQPPPSQREPRTHPAAETWPEPFGELTSSQSRRMVVIDDEAFRRLPGAIAVARAGQALARGDVADTVKYARQVLDLLTEDDHLNRGGAAGFLGLAAWTSGDLEAAHRAYAEGMAHLQMAGNISDAIGGAITLADIRIAQGRLRAAMHTYEQALQLATAQGAPALVLRGTADIYVGLSALHCERNELQAATQHLLRSKELGEHAGFPQNRYRWRVAMARIREIQGDPNGALDLLQEAERLYVSAFSPNVRPIPALKTRVWIAQGRLGEALGWARAQGLSADDDLSYLREFEHITLARLLLARYHRDHADHTRLEAMGLLERLLQAAQAGARMGSVIEILVLQALAHQCQGDIPAGLVPLERALTLAEPEGYVRLFVDEGERMAQLLRAAVAPKGHPAPMSAYANQLLTAFEPAPQTTLDPSPLPTSPAAYPLIEPLSERELEVLRLFKTELSGPEIAQQLVIGLSTVRTHAKSIYSKLNVNSRRAAVQRAAELNLL